jgi:short-subunit dehydrogenase
VFLTGRDAALVGSRCEELGCVGLAIDLGEADAAVRLYASAREALGGIDVLVNNAGFNRAKEPIVEIRAETVDESYSVNLRAPMLLAREALREMGGRGSGHILNVISSVVHARMENFSVYSAMKNALHGFTGCLIKEARLVGVKVTGVYPGGVDTTFRAVARPEYMRAESAARMIVQCIEAPEDVVVHELVYRPMVEANF